MAEDVHARLRVGPVGGQRGEDDAGGAEHERDRAGPLDAHAERRRGAVARAGRHGDARGGAAGDLGRLERARHPGLGGSSSASSTADEKRRSATSKSSVPEASATSIARSPQSRSRT